MTATRPNWPQTSRAGLNSAGLYDIAVTAVGAMQIQIEFIGLEGSQPQSAIYVPSSSFAAGGTVSVSPVTQGAMGEFRVNQTMAGDQTNPSIAMDAAGDFVITWTSSGRSTTRPNRRTSSPGVPSQHHAVRRGRNRRRAADRSRCRYPAANRHNERPRQSRGEPDPRNRRVPGIRRSGGNRHHQPHL